MHNASLGACDAFNKAAGRLKEFIIKQLIINNSFLPHIPSLTGRVGVGLIIH